MAIDMLTLLCYRLPLIEANSTDIITWRQLTARFGNRGEPVYQFRHLGPGRPHSGLVLLPGRALRHGDGNAGTAEHMRVVAHHLVADRRGDVGKIEQPGFFHQACMKHDLKEQIVEFVLQHRHVAAREIASATS
jgi:hypothetical protein